MTNMSLIYYYKYSILYIHYWIYVYFIQIYQFKIQRDMNIFQCNIITAENNIRFNLEGKLKIMYK